MLAAVVWTAAMNGAPAQAKSEPSQAANDRRSWRLPDEQVVKIGVLAARGRQKCLEEWQPTADYLSDRIPGYHFRIVPLDFEEVYPAAERKSVDFILLNPSLYVALERLHSANRLVTLRSGGSLNAPPVFGGVIFCKTDRNDIQGLEDLEGKAFGAVEQNSLGGWQAAWREFREHGVEPPGDFSQLQFLGTHDAVVQAVLRGVVDAGAVRTNTLERMAQEGTIDLADVRVIHQFVAGDGAEPRRSTRAYPEWPLAELSHTRGALAEQVAAVLMNMPPDCSAAKAAGCSGWTTPRNYQSVHDCLKELRLSPYEDFCRVSVSEVLHQHWQWLLAGLLAPVAIALAAVWISRVNHRHARQLAAKDEQARESEKRFMDVLYSSDDAILLIDGDQFVDCNEATARMLQYADRDNFLMMHPSQISPPEQPDGRKSRDKAEVMMQAAFENGSHRFEWVHRKANGEDFPVEVTLTAITYHGKSMLHCHWRDLTEQKRAEEALAANQKKLRTITDSALDAVIMIDSTGKVAHWNPAAETIFGYSPEEILGCDVHAVLTPFRYREAATANFSQFAKTGRGAGIAKTLEMSALRKDGLEFPVEMSVNSIAQDDGWWAVAVLRDITDRKQAEQTLKKAKEEAEAANRAKSEFLASMSHELRTPLTGILGFADLLLLSTPDEQQRREYAELIRRSGRHLLELINEILDLSRIEADRLTINRSPCSPHDILNEVVSIMRAEAQTKGLDLLCRWNGAVPSVVVTDGARLRQILLNLVGNAIKFTQHGAVEVVASFESSEHDNRLVVDITDTGIGIPRDKLQCIFEPFVQADSSVTRRFGGTGLGLAISARMAKALGGDIRVTSEEGIGSTFTVVVDAGRPEGIEMLDSPPADGLRPSDEHGSPGPFHFRPSNILLVEDGEINRKLICASLEQAGLNVSTAENGEVGVALATSNHFDLILMDMQMPVLDGYAATGKLRKLGCKAPIVALTAHAMEGDKEKCLAAGCSHYVKKPIDIQTLLATVSAAIGHNIGPRGTSASDAAGANPSTRLVSSLPSQEPVFREIIVEFVEYLDRLLAEMRQAAVRKDVVQLAEMAHSLKGSAGTAGFHAFTEPARRLERLAKQRRLDAIGSAIDALVDLADRITVPTEADNAASLP